MAFSARGLIPLLQPAKSPVCAQCRRTFGSSAALRAGHNKWSKIRHDKAANDLKKNAARTIFTKNIAFCSKRASTPSLVSAPVVMLRNAHALENKSLAPTPNSTPSWQPP